jgi:hypothetical protein
MPEKISAYNLLSSLTIRHFIEVLPNNKEADTIFVVIPIQRTAGNALSASVPVK